MATENIFGINIGTKNTFLAVLDKGSHTPKLLNKFSSEVIVTNQVDKNDIDPRDYFSGFLRLIGKEFENPIVQKEKKKGLYKIIKAPNGEAWVETSYGKQCSPVELLKTLVSKIKRAVLSHNGGGTNLPQIVITFPCKVNMLEMMQKMTLWDGTGEKTVLLMHEFSAAAAAAAYGLHKVRGLFAIVDIGARTLDITFYVSPLGDERGAYRVKGVPQRDMYLGGDDFDDVILKYLVSEFKSMEGIDLVEDRRLHKAAEEAKIALSSSIETEIYLPSIIVDPTRGSRDLKVILTREKFESLANGLTEKMKEFGEKCLSKAGLDAKDLEGVLVVGGMANVPVVRKVVKEVFGKVPKRGVKYEEAVALGAAMADKGSMGLNPLCYLI